MIRLFYGHTNTYFIDGLLVDTDLPGTMPAFRKALKQNGFSLGDIRFLLSTHYHPDHMGLNGELQAAGVRLLVLDWQLPHLHFSDEIFARREQISFTPLDESALTVLTCAESRAFLASIGIPGEILPTDSHSPDGIALLLDDGHAFVGDLEPRQFVGGYADAADSPLCADWERLLARSPRYLHFGHYNDQILP